ncbi:TPA: ribonuclease Y [Streptococcus pyogenes]|uniref:Ribonuclease Y n=1 Tax=Streptococcus pyogenes serotype M2 (strain MGAS10270) TaxID=370552 RepID=RNY_STRPD|nr:ribonuclease Y [Streptococcus pyogenes]Q1JFN6.1 RecName: Full=Ribonuclease Y; Short=RNase Y [Streptococcus pyogenes MGAS10270]ERL16286.1 ribonuclease Y [Streptococcus pyogenes GA41046]HER4561145.1 ribonuclease Y [Streptococcus pyogenes NGAS671]HER4770877.1 ribonuclease Y [Streptococcus pyogenes NGAS226]ABF34523.1 Hydrolase [Streptococcus pyogenes MGAS10270]PMD80618.1 ribonuclease Y [Streptococcus pyogenes]
MVNIILLIVSALIGLILGYALISIRLKSAKEAAELTLLNAEQEAVDIRGKAEVDAEHIKKTAKRESKANRKELLLKAKEEARKYREEIEQEFKSERQELKQLETRLAERSLTLDRKDENLSSKEKVLDSKEQSLTDKSKHIDERQLQVEKLEEEKKAELEKVAAMTIAEAREVILMETENKLTHEIATRIRDAERDIKDRTVKTAKDLLAQAMQRLAGEYVTEQTITSVHLPDDNMKGRIIGREGRNIRTLESLTGIDVIIDDTPEVVILSGFDPIRREIARMTLESLIADGRIHPARIEELVEKNRLEMDNRIREYGEAAAYEIGAPNLHPDLIKIMGRLQFRTSFGQNVLRHSVEVGKLAGILAGELGENVALARRAGFLHDMGKAIDREVEGSHVEIGMEFARKYKEHPVVVNTIASHHGDVEPDSVIAVLVAAADALSSARPGARNESMENYIKRLRDLEEIATSFDGVQNSFALQAGREIRIMVQPEKISDDQVVILSHKVREKIEHNLDYPGNIKVTVIREMRAVDYAK